jgi:FkbM family methyltransferase
VGAYHGHYSILLRRNFHRLVAIEPLPSHVGVLRRIMALRGVSNVDIVEAAISERRGQDMLHTMPMSSESGLEPSIEAVGTAETNTITLDSLLPNEQFSLVKVDVEGSELKVLKGAEKGISRIAAWLIEIHDESNVCDVERFLVQSGYSLTWVDRNHLFAFRKNGQVVEAFEASE